MTTSTRDWVSKFRGGRQIGTGATRFFPFPQFPMFRAAKPFFPRPSLSRKLPPKVYGEMGDLEVRLARSRRDIKRAQKLRFQVFYNEMSAVADAETIMSRRDRDPYDPLCDHLLVVDKSYANKKRPWPVGERVVGTYRLLRQEVAECYGGFYTQGEYDIAPLVEAKRGDYRFVELGRSCVLKPYRNKRTLELLWHGIWTYVREHGADVMIGCASFEGTDPTAHAMALSFLYHNALAPEDWRVRAHNHLRVDMDMMPASEIDMRAALKALPPLIKGYLRVGAYIGDGAVIDHQFGTTDVLMVLPIEAINERYFSHFGAPDSLVSRIAPGPKQIM